MKERNISLVILILFILNSCAIAFIPKKMTYKFSTDNTGIDSLINVDGFYISEFKRNGIKTHTALLLYRDGSVAYPIRNLFSSEEYVVNNLVDKQTSKAKRFSTFWGGWGVYKLKEDTIKMEVSLWY